VQPDARVLVLFENAFDFIPAFLACMHCGAIPASMQIPNGPGKLAKLRDIVAVEAVEQIIVPESLLAKGWFRQLFSEDEGIRLRLLPLPAEAGDAVVAEGSEARAFDGARIIYGQLSSGTTGRSKWINITSDNVKANTDAIGVAIRQQPDWRHLSWLPHYHDLGLVAGLFFTLFHGNTTWLIDPLDFVGRPQVWLEAMSRYRIHFSHSPCFGLDLCTRRIDAGQLPGDTDLSELVSIMVCAEPIRQLSLERFIHRFGHLGIRETSFVTCFGMAECTLAATMQAQRTPFRVVHHPELDRSFVSCGTPVQDMTVSIRPVDDLPQGVGEVILHGTSVSPDHAGTGIHSGDIGFLHEGELYITGRLKEVIILNGVKHLLHELEATVETLPFVHDRGSLACTRSGPEGESLVLMVELKRECLRADGNREYSSKITRCLNLEHGISPGAVLFFPPASLPKTSSGKKRRIPLDILEKETQGKVIPYP
jgi:acyl-CoA synthetase (AMP-forming)/AMP-acid ligase II